ncbi:VPLPA-CTERM sorting domain-containing protein [Tropicibacter sp. S64]|uniref:VPLPA-CTERM sorting domain-containing protein n=1 Tax=Tropicibacter sp. S64 TaxID=3415122 RepID=UPI003C798E8E
MKAVLLAGVMWAAAFSAPAADAATLVTDGTTGIGSVHGATGVIVGGNTYTVTFQDGSCAGLFSGCDEQTDFPFPSVPGSAVLTSLANDAVNALLTQVFPLISGVEANPRLIRGCTSTAVCNALFPYFYNSAISGANVNLIGVQNTSSAPAERFFRGTSQTSDFSILGQETYVTWTPSSINAPVPLPAALPLLMAGLASFGVLRRRRRTG